jgi:hypothetical protein
MAKINARPKYYRTDPDRDWMPDLDHLRSWSPSARASSWSSIRIIRQARYIRRRPPRDSCARRRAQPDDCRRRGLRRDRIRGAVPLLGTLDPDAPIISLSSLSKAYLRLAGARGG